LIISTQLGWLEWCPLLAAPVFLAPVVFVDAFLVVAGICMSGLGGLKRLGDKVMKGLKKKLEERM
jgi:hypothetical protein